MKHHKKSHQQFTVKKIMDEGTLWCLCKSILLIIVRHNFLFYHIMDLFNRKKDLFYHIENLFYHI